MSKFGIEDVPCASCQRGYAGEHSCDLPDYCPCDRRSAHVTADHLNRTPDQGLGIPARQRAADDGLYMAVERAIRNVTDLWDEPLDEVHDVPQIVNAVLALVAAALIADDGAPSSHHAHDWTRRGDDDDPWRECFLCGAVENLTTPTTETRESAGESES